jgi:hypothetical protein
VMEFELAEDLSATEVRDRMERTAPEGLVINKMEQIDAGTNKPTMRQMTFEVPVPAPRQADVQCRIDELLETHPFPIDRHDGRPTFDLHTSCGRLSLAEGNLRFDVLASASRSVRPREILAALGIDDLEAAGAVMRRMAVEIT